MNLEDLETYREYYSLCHPVTPGRELGALRTMVTGIVLLMISWTADTSSMVGSELQQLVLNICRGTYILGMPRLWVRLDPSCLIVTWLGQMAPVSRISYTAERMGTSLSVEIPPLMMMTEECRRSVAMIVLGILPNLVRSRTSRQISGLDYILQSRGLRETICPGLDRNCFCFLCFNYFCILIEF